MDFLPNELQIEILSKLDDLNFIYYLPNISEPMMVNYALLRLKEIFEEGEEIEIGGAITTLDNYQDVIAWIIANPPHGIESILSDIFYTSIRENKPNIINYLYLSGIFDMEEDLPKSAYVDIFHKSSEDVIDVFLDLGMILEISEVYNYLKLNDWVIDDRVKFLINRLSDGIREGIKDMFWLDADKNDKYRLIDVVFDVVFDEVQ